MVGNLTLSLPGALPVVTLAPLRCASVPTYHAPLLGVRKEVTSPRVPARDCYRCAYGHGSHLPDQSLVGAKIRSLGPGQLLVQALGASRGSNCPRTEPPDTWHCCAQSWPLLPPLALAPVYPTPGLDRAPLSTGVSPLELGCGRMALWSLGRCITQDLALGTQVGQAGAPQPGSQAPAKP